MRCDFMRDGLICAVEFRKEPSHELRGAESLKLFAGTNHDHRADGFEVWDGARFIDRHPANFPV
jgi:hypothetical protein